MQKGKMYYVQVSLIDSNPGEKPSNIFFFSLTVRNALK